MALYVTNIQVCTLVTCSISIDSAIFCMPTACSPQDCTSCTSMIDGRLRSVQIPAEGSDSHPFATCVCPIPVSVFRFPFFFLYGPSSFHQRSYHISPFSPLHFLCSVMLSSISALPCIVRLSSSTLACHILLMFSHFSTL